ncbi:MAG: chitinase, partial [Maribacter sp.]
MIEKKTMNWKNIIISNLILLVFMLGCSPKTKKQGEESQLDKPSHEPVIMAYYVPEPNYEPEKIPVEKLTHIIYSFTNVIEGEMKFRNPEEAGLKLEALVKQKNRNPGLKVMIACGGWGADGFSDMALTEEGRSKFIASASEFIVKYKLDGIDMDWEYPGISGAGTMARDVDTKNFTALMKGLREMLDTLDAPKVLTFASAGWKRYYDFIELNEVMKYANFTNVMTYDLVSGVSEYTGHHTALGAVSI